VSHVTINGQQISWPFIQKIRRAMGGDWDRTIDAFWQARNAKGELGIIKYITAGMKRDGNRYIFTASKEREKGIDSPEWQAVLQWWKAEVYTKKETMAPIKNIFADLAAGRF
jgi:hypothetical protein